MYLNNFTVYSVHCTDMRMLWHYYFDHTILVTYTLFFCTECARINESADKCKVDQ